MSTPALFKNAEFLRAEEDRLTRAMQRQLGALRKQLDDLVRSYPFDAVSLGRQPARYDAMVARAEQLIHDAYVQLNATMRTELAALGKRQGFEAAMQMQAMTRVDTVSLALPTKAMMRSILTTDPIQGQVMGKWWKDQSAATQRGFRQQIQIGMTRQESVSQLVARIRGESAPGGGYVGGVMNTSTRNAEALVRTSVNEVANQAALAVYSQDPSVSEEFEFVATLDERTTEECQAADGKVFRYDDPAALVPPLHWNCRSTIVPVIKYKELGLAPPAEERMTYSEWKAGDTATAAATDAPELDAIVVGRDLRDEFGDHSDALVRAAQAWGSDTSVEDGLQKAINAIQGFDGLPMTGDADAFKRVLAQGGEGFWRGVTRHAGRSPQALLDELRGGKFYAGQGLFGNGTYIAAFQKAERDAAQIALEYAGGNDKGLIRGVVRRGARVGNLRDIGREALAWERQIQAALEKLEKDHLTDKVAFAIDDLFNTTDKRYTKAARALLRAQPKEMQPYIKQYEHLMVQKKIAEDPGRYAAFLGYDAYDTGNYNYWVFLNRTAVFLDTTIF